jgi:hypothetical protein
MEQAARSGKQNMAEGYLQKSLEGRIKLLGVARGSLEELLNDYLDFLRQKKLRFWLKDSGELRAVRGLVYNNYNFYNTIFMENENQKNAGQKISASGGSALGGKFGVIAAVLIIAGLVAGYAIGIFAYLKIIGPYAAEMKYKAFLEDYLKPYKEDFIGGDTPEETIDLFIAALKKGDYELASRYFVVGEQKVWEKDFKESKRENIEKWIIELESNKNSWHKELQDENRIEFWYNTGEGESERTNSIYLRKNINNKWKIGGF